MSEPIEFLAQVITISGETIGVSIPIKFKRLRKVKLGDYVAVSMKIQQPQENAI